MLVLISVLEIMDRKIANVLERTLYITNKLLPLINYLTFREIQMN